MNSATNSTEVTLGTTNASLHHPTFAGLLPNIPLYEADKTLIIRNFFAIIENVGILGHWDDATKLRVAKC